MGLVFEDKPVATPDAVRDGRYTLETLLIEPLINASSALVRRSVSPRFPTWTRQGSDMLYFCELSQVGPFGYVDVPLVGYRMHPDQQTRGATAWSEHCEARLRWVEQQRDSLGDARAESLRHSVMQQIVEWLTLGRLNRQWDRYHALREYARGLDWGTERPAELDRRLFPRTVYALKDVFDDLRGRTGHGAARGRA